MNRRARRKPLTKRVHVSDHVLEKQARENVFIAADWRCEYCGIRVRRTGHTADPQLATLDHKMPISLGGTETRDNLACACQRCNTKKGNMTAEDFRAEYSMTRRKSTA